jgi:hypothetical protein
MLTFFGFYLKLRVCGATKYGKTEVWIFFLKNLKFLKDLFKNNHEQPDFFLFLLDFELLFMVILILSVRIL